MADEIPQKICPMCGRESVYLGDGPCIACNIEFDALRTIERMRGREAAGNEFTRSGYLAKVIQRHILDGKRETVNLPQFLWILLQDDFADMLTIEEIDGSIELLKLAREFRTLQN